MARLKTGPGIPSDYRKSAQHKSISSYCTSRKSTIDRMSYNGQLYNELNNHTCSDACVYQAKTSIHSLYIWWRTGRAPKVLFGLLCHQYYPNWHPNHKKFRSLRHLFPGCLYNWEHLLSRSHGDYVTMFHLWNRYVTLMMTSQTPALVVVCRPPSRMINVKYTRMKITFHCQRKKVR